MGVTEGFGALQRMRKMIPGRPLTPSIRFLHRAMRILKTWSIIENSTIAAEELMELFFLLRDKEDLQGTCDDFTAELPTPQSYHLMNRW